MFIDARIPILSGAGDLTGAAVLIEGAPVPDGTFGMRFDLDKTEHAVGCACCVSRGPVAEALSQLFLARARADTPFFIRVRALYRTEAGWSAIASAATSDPVVSARFRLAGEAS